MRERERDGRMGRRVQFKRKADERERARGVYVYANLHFPRSSKWMKSAAFVFRRLKKGDSSITDNFDNNSSFVTARNSIGCFVPSEFVTVGGGGATNIRSVQIPSKCEMCAQYFSRLKIGTD